MIRSAVTVSLVPKARGGPFVYWDNLEMACDRARHWRFDAVEVFAPGPKSLDVVRLTDVLKERGLRVAAVGTGAGMVLHALSLIDPDKERRAAAREFVRGMIDLGSRFQAPAIIGSMQGKWGGDLDRAAGLELLGQALEDLGRHALRYGLPLLYEPLNRYETNLINTLGDGVAFLDSLAAENVKLLADLFHMNIEEADMAEAIVAGKGKIGHIHFVDSNRRAVGLGHLDVEPVARAIRSIDYDGFLSVEAIPVPDSETAAHQTMVAFRKYFGESQGEAAC
jgi:sugar phosphate isomerase/epimerase